MPSQNISFRASEDLLRKIRSRDPDASKYPGATAKRDVERWYSMLEEYHSQIAHFTPDECVVLIYYVGTYGGRPSHDAVVRIGEVLRSTAVSALDEFYDAAQASLGDKLTLMSLMGRYAAWDAAERYEALALEQGRKGGEGTVRRTFGMALHTVGLHSYDLSPLLLRRVERVDAVESDLLPGAYLLAARPVAGMEESDEQA